MQLKQMCQLNGSVWTAGCAEYQIAPLRSRHRVEYPSFAMTSDHCTGALRGAKRKRGWGFLLTASVARIAALRRIAVGRERILVTKPAIA
jgi:hypothetical protein